MLLHSEGHRGAPRTGAGSTIELKGTEVQHEILGMVRVAQAGKHGLSEQANLSACPWCCCTVRGTVAHLVQVHVAGPGHVNLILEEHLLQRVPKVIGYSDVALEVVAVDGGGVDGSACTEARCCPALHMQQSHWLECSVCLRSHKGYVLDQHG